MHALDHEMTEKSIRELLDAYSLSSNSFKRFKMLMEAIEIIQTVDSSLPLLNEVIGALVALLQGGRANTLWIDLEKDLNDQDSDHDAAIIRESQLLFYGFRQCANTLGEEMPLELTGDAWMIAVADGLISAVMMHQQRGHGDSALLRVTQTLHTEARQAVLERLCQLKYPKHDRKVFVQAAMSGQWALGGIPIVLRYLSRKERVGEVVECAADVLSLLVAKALHDASSAEGPQSATSVIDEVFLSKSPGAYCAQTVARKVVRDGFPDNGAYRGLILCAVGHTWGNPFELARGADAVHAYQSAVVLAALERAEKEDLSMAPQAYTGHVHGAAEVQEVGAPPVTVLSRAVSAHLDLSDTIMRVRGMRVAVSFSEILGHSVHFDEVDEADKRERESKAADTVRGGKDKRPGDRTAEGPAQDDSTGNDNGIEHYNDHDIGDESSDDSEIDAPASWLGDGDGEGGEPLGGTFAGSVGLKTWRGETNQVIYLQHCLDVFQESDKAGSGDGGGDSANNDPAGRARRLEAVLEALPEVVRRQPVDGPDLAPALVRELLSMTNSYNFEKDIYDSRRRDCLDAFADVFPEQTVPMLAWAVGESKRLSIGARLEALYALTRATQLLSGHFDEEFQVTVRTPGGKLSTLDTDSSDLDKEYAAVTAGTTVVKRPCRLAQVRLGDQRVGKRTIMYRKNRLPEFANTILQPIDAILATAVSSASVMAPSTAAHGTDTDVDGVAVMLPAQALHSLALLVRCAANTIIHEDIAACALAVFEKLRAAPALTLRRAAATTAMASVEAWRHCRLRQRRGLVSPLVRPTSALEALKNMTLLPRF